MPKGGKSPFEWKKRLHEYARGVLFGRGERPRKHSKWDKAIEQIEKCPKHGGAAATTDLFGRRISCNCGYHLDDLPGPSNASAQVGQVQPSPSPVSTAAAAAAATATTTASSTMMLPPPAKKRAVEAPAASEPSTRPLTGSVPSGQSSSASSSFSSMSVLSAVTTVPSTSILSTSSTTSAVTTSSSIPSTSSATSAAEDLPSLPYPDLPRRQKKKDLKQLPKGWEIAMPLVDRKWIRDSLYGEKDSLPDKLMQRWWFPPDVDHTAPPVADRYHLRRLFLWMPRRMWKVDFKCCHCKERLTSKGLYNRVRLVLDFQDYYYLATEYMECRPCKGTFIAWDHRMLEQLPHGIRCRFPVVLTYKYACDKSIISLLRGRTLGNSPTAVQHTVHEAHSAHWMDRHMQFLCDCQRYSHHRRSLLQTVPVFDKPAPMHSLPTMQWFLAVYVRDVLSRLPDLLAYVTSTYGSILKIDSTKKVTKKLAGADAGSASWATNVGNERGEIVQCVITASEGMESLKKMADGIMDRYEAASQPHPVLLYTDRDCCAMDGPGRYKSLFDRWPALLVRLDIWHFMRRLAFGVTTESHPLYGTFLSRLSSCIFEWDEGDVDALLEAKRAELSKNGAPNPSVAAAKAAVTSKELANHCRRRTRGVESTVDMIEALLLSLSDATDLVGVPLLREEMKNIWEDQKRHVACIQDPHGVSLYTVTGHIEKGGKRLPVFRCARGSTSLESFHCHLVRFIPGTSASGLNFQAYLVDGVYRWNCDRSQAAVDSAKSPYRTYDVRQQERLHTLSKAVYNESSLPHFRPPSQYTGELFGVAYLYDQSGCNLLPDDLDQAIDEEFEDATSFEVDVPAALHDDAEDMTLPALGGDSGESSDEDHDNEGGGEEEEEEERGGEEERQVSDSRRISGWDKVDQLADALLKIRGFALSDRDVEKIKSLYDELVDYDKQPLVFHTRQVRPSRGRFGRAKRTGHATVDAVKRCFLSAGLPASSPSKSRVVEAICVKLCDTITQPLRERHRGQRKRYTSRWKLILNEYNCIKARLSNSPSLIERTSLALFPINETTLIRWYKNTTRMNEVKLLLQGRSLPGGQLSCTSDPLPPAQDRPTSPPPPPDDPVVFSDPEDTTGQARVRSSRSSTVATVISTTTAASTTTTATTTTNTATVISMSRTTEWRRRKAAAAAATTTATVATASAASPTPMTTSTATPKPRKAYSCRICGQPMSKQTGHTQFKGKRYCPNESGQVSQEEWLQQQKTQAAAKKSQGQ